MKTRLTPFAKLFIATVIIGVVGYLGWLEYSKRRAGTGGGGGGEPVAGKSGDGPATARDKRIVIGVNDFGGAFALVAANDGAAPGPASLFTKAGLDVEVKVIRGSKERLKAFDEGEVDVMLLTLDYLANLAPVYKQKNVDLKSFLFVDWSRGNAGIVAKPEYPSIESLKKARIATTRNTPTHYLLLSLLHKSNLGPADIDAVKSNLVFATKTPLAGEMFQRGEVDAVAIWEPHLSQSMAGGKGRVLVTTETATNLIADVLFARADWLKAHEREVSTLVSTYFEGVKAVQSNPARAVELNAKAFSVKPGEAEDMLRKIKLSAFADNRAFFGLETEASPYERLYTEATRFWQKEGILPAGVTVAAGDTKWLKPLEAAASQYKDERVVENFKFAAPSKDAQPVMTRSVSIYFGSGQSALDPNARRVIDDFADTLAVMGNTYVRVEGNTDNVGSAGKNASLSKARAEAVVDYLVSRHRFDKARFVAVGNGPSNPVGDNKTPAGRELNRRTDFKIIANR